MPSVTVESLAKIIGSEGEALLSQMKEAGLSHKDVKDEVTDQDKKTLLEFLKEQQNKTSKTISLNKTTAKTESENTGTVSITRKTISREMYRNKIKTYIKKVESLISKKDQKSALDLLKKVDPKLQASKNKKIFSKAKISRIQKRLNSRVVQLKKK